MWQHRHDDHQRRRVSELPRLGGGAGGEKDAGEGEGGEGGGGSAQRSFSEQEVVATIGRFRKWLVADRVHVLRRCGVFKNWPEPALLRLAGSAMMELFESTPVRP